MKIRVLLPVAWLAAIHIAACGAGFLSPWEPVRQNRSLPFAPPPRLRLIDPNGHIHRRPFICGLSPVRGSLLPRYFEDCGRTFTIRFFTTGFTYCIGPFCL